MKIQCQDHSIEFILQSHYFEIPRFQRPYSWERENWEEFWNDVFLTKQKDYFIGSVVTFAKGPYKAIVDGQQRLTTITLLLAVIRDNYRKFGFSDRASGAQNFIERNNKNNEATFVLKTETSYPYFQTAIQSIQPQQLKIQLGEEETLLHAAFQFFNGKVDEETDSIKTGGAPSETTKKNRIRNRLDELRDALLSLKLIYVELDNEDDAYQVFETLNTRGKDLATTDLLKNHLARILREKNSLNDDVKVRWSLMSDNIKSISADGIDLDGFLYHYWLASNPFTQKRDIFKAVKESVKSKTTAKKLLDDLLVFSEVYRDLYEPGLRKWRTDELEVKSALEAINRFRVKHPLPLMMTALRKYESKSLSKGELLRILQVIEIFTFVNTNLMNARSSGGVAQMYAFHAKTLSSAIEPTRRQKAINDFVTKLSLKLPTEAVFLEKFRALRYSDKFSTQKREVQYVVTKLFTWMFPAVAINPNEMSIEHIEPQSSTVIPDVDVASIGNLWFLKTAFNNQLANSPATNKLTKYKAGQLPCDNTLANATIWTKTEIENRTTELGHEFWLVVLQRFGLSKQKKN
ncbi:MAG: DUF262 domain-containing HNH endonuclease family protein [Gammaproteobacteria bacterium]|nr:DUF262 domain-containing HNH endonuclease family protein [Gammaproteobacteria bacterium]MBU0785550.1 DUF262 domain-containing HNH endonuclease family protein [Gammaproteobacteria bacterium]MBU0816838.1 DUF262 domain-containing HNH endonuclease family protein [Gammaproteobacteria bacterium]MBU1787002.1 DUF262 domain-containing HNH endonuclease family protein [Gammaproteobacteria bacterium]